MNNLKSLLLSVIILSSNLIYCMIEDKDKSDKKQDYFSKLPDEIKHEVFGYIFMDSDLESKSIIELQGILNLRCINKKSLSLINGAKDQENIGYINKIRSIIEKKKEEIGFKLIKVIKKDNLEEVTNILNISLEKKYYNMIDNSGRTALMYACQSNNKDLIQLLINKGTDINTKNKNGVTAIMYACEKGIFELLIKNGADINVQDTRGVTTLMIEAPCDYDNVKLLIEHKANLNLQDNSGRTALMYAANSGRKDIVKLLIDGGLSGLDLANTGAEINLKDKLNQTAFDLAKTQEVKDIIQEAMNTNK